MLFFLKVKRKSEREKQNKKLKKKQNNNNNKSKAKVAVQLWDHAHGSPETSMRVLQEVLKLYREWLIPPSTGGRCKAGVFNEHLQQQDVEKKKKNSDGGISKT